MTFLYRRTRSFRVPPVAGLMVVLAVSGCAPTLDVTYGKSRGASLNGTSVLTRMLRDRQREVRTAVRLSDELANWATGIIRFAPYPGPPSLEEARWYRDWLAAGGERRLVYVVRDFDTVAEYWQEVRASLTDSTGGARRAEAEANQNAAADWFDELPVGPQPVAGSREWFATGPAWSPPRVCTRLSGPWADGVNAKAARVIVHKPLETDRGLRLLEGDGKPLVVEKMIEWGKVLVIANGSFLLNEALVNPARRPLAERAIDWVCTDTTRLALVEGSFVLADDAETPTIWSLTRRIPSLRWVAVHAGLAAVIAALARAPRLGRPRPVPLSGTDRPAEHALALGTLLARTKAGPEAREILDRYQRWRFPRTVRTAAEPRASRQ